MKNESENLKDISAKLKKLAELKRELNNSEFNLNCDNNILSRDMEQSISEEDERIRKYVNDEDYGYIIFYKDSEPHIKQRINKIKDIDCEIESKEYSLNDTYSEENCPKERPYVDEIKVGKKFEIKISLWAIIVAIFPLAFAIGLFEAEEKISTGFAVVFLIGAVAILISSLIINIKKSNKEYKTNLERNQEIKDKNQTIKEYNCDKLPLEIEEFNQKRIQIKNDIKKLKHKCDTLKTEIIQIHIRSFKEQMEEDVESAQIELPILEQKVADLKKEIDDEEYDFNNIRQFNANDLEALAGILDLGRADSYKEAINLFLQEKSDKEFKRQQKERAEQLARQQQEEMLRQLERQHQQQEQRERQLDEQRQAEERRHNREIEANARQQAEAARQQAEYAKQQAEATRRQAINAEKRMRQEELERNKYKGPCSGGVNGDPTLCIGCGRKDCSRLKCRGFIPKD